jgi:hypothetical protein
MDRGPAVEVLLDLLLIKPIAIGLEIYQIANFQSDMAGDKISSPQEFVTGLTM